MTLIESMDDVARLRGQVLRSCDRALDRVRHLVNSDANPLEVLWQMKFDRVGWHMFRDEPLNIMGQLSEVFAWLAALRAVEILLERHPDVRQYKVNAGSSGRGSDIESVPQGAIAAETFAQIGPDDGKLASDRSKVAATNAASKYVFFYSPQFPEGRRREREADGVMVWAVEIPR